MSESFSVGELALMLPPPECNCAVCRKGVGEIVTVIGPLRENWSVNGGRSHEVRYLDGKTNHTRPEMLQKLPQVHDEVKAEEPAHV